MIASVRLGLGRGRAALALALVCASTACGVSQWRLRTTQPDIVLQWPYQPGKAKLTYVRSLTGFSQQRGTASKLRAFMVGKGHEDSDEFVLPVAVATGADGRIAVADIGRKCVHLYIPAQQRYVRLTGSKEVRMTSPVAVIFDDALRLFLSDSTGMVFAFGPGGDYLFVLRKAGAEPFQRPTGLAYSPRTHLLYVVDTLANRIHAFGPTGDLAFSFGQRGEKEGSFNFPTHVFWSSGELYVTDALGFRIEIFDEMGTPAGSFGHHGDGSGDLAMPKGVAVDKDGIIYVADGLFDNVQLFDRRGGFLLTLGRRGVDFGEMWLPSGVFISESNELYVCDTYNRRIQIFRIMEQYAEPTS